MSENDKNPNSNHNAESSSKINELINALHPLCNDVKWMRDVIDKIKSVNFPDSDFEVSGLARIIAYEIIKQNPELLDELDTKATPLKDLIIQCLNNIEISKKRKESVIKLAEELFNKEAAAVAINRSKIR